MRSVFKPTLMMNCPRHRSAHPEHGENATTSRIPGIANAVAKKLPPTRTMAAAAAAVVSDGGGVPSPVAEEESNTVILGGVAATSEQRQQEEEAEEGRRQPRPSEPAATAVAQQPSVSSYVIYRGPGVTDV